MMKKITKRDNFNALLAIEAVSANSQLVDFINHELELLDKKNSTGKPATDKNAEYKAVILDILQDKKMTVTEIQKASDLLSDVSINKVNGVIRQMRAEGTIIRTEEKHKAYFSKA